MTGDKDLYGFIKGYYSSKDIDYADDPTFLGFKVVVNVNDPNNPLFNESSQFPSAINHLLDRGEGHRAKLLIDFKSRISHLLSSSNYYLQSIDLGDIMSIDAARADRSTDKVITIETLESIDMRVATIIDRYRKATWDEVNLRWVIPSHLLLFDMSVVVGEVRRIKAMVDGLYDGGETGMKLINDNLAYHIYTFHGCELDTTQSNPFLSSISNSSQEPATNTIQVRYDSITERHKMTFMDVLSNTMDLGADDLELHNRFYTIFGSTDEQPAGLKGANGGDNSEVDEQGRRTPRVTNPATALRELLERRAGETTGVGSQIYREVGRSEALSFLENRLSSPVATINRYLQPANLIGDVLKLAISYIDSKIKAVLLDSNVYGSGPFSASATGIIQGLVAGGVFAIGDDNRIPIEQLTAAINTYYLNKLTIYDQFGDSNLLGQVDGLVLDGVSSVVSLGGLVLYSSFASGQLGNISVNQLSSQELPDGVIETFNQSLMSVLESDTDVALNYEPVAPLPNRRMTVADFFTQVIGNIVVSVAGQEPARLSDVASPTIITRLVEGFMGNLGKISEADDKVVAFLSDADNVELLNKVIRSSLGDPKLGRIPLGHSGDMVRGLDVNVFDYAQNPLGSIGMALRKYNIYEANSNPKGANYNTQ